MERYRKLFLEEALKHLKTAEEILLDPEGGLAGDPLDALFREFHSLKGMAASMGYEAMAALAHRSEDLLQAWRAGEVVPEDRADQFLLKVCDRLAAMRDDVAEGGRGELDWSDLVEGLGMQKAPAGEGELSFRVHIDPESGSTAARAYLTLVRFRELDPEVRSQPSETEILRGEPLPSVDLTVHDVDAEKVREVYETLTEVCGLEFLESPDRAAPGGEGDEGGEEGAPGPPEEEAVEVRAPVRLPDTVPVPVPLLDAFVDILGEMTVARSHLEQTARGLGSEILKEEVENLSKLVRDFHGRVMSLRMLPFRLITGSLRRLVREHASTLEKDVSLRISGEEIGIDKSVLLQVSDPLVHLLRNALDHGIETSEERRRSGKPPQGTIEIEVARSRNRVEITVADDGRGVDVEEVRRKAVERGIFREEDSRRASPSDVLSCLFRPGFSTRAVVTELSGRGVGLDVVKSKLVSLGGTIEFTSKPGEGSRFLLSLPLSVAIVPVLMVVVGENVLAFPTSSVIRTVEAQPRDVRKKDGDYLLLTETGQVPILSLARVLRLRGKQRFERVPLVLMSSPRGVTALAVDRFLREEDLFVKPPKGPLRALQGLSGYSVLGDGQLVFLLDPPTLFGR